MRDRRVLVTMAALGAVTLCLLGCDAGRPSASPAGAAASHAGRPSATPAGGAASGPVLGRWLPVRSTGQARFGPVSCVRGAAGWCTALGMTQGGPSRPVAVVATAKAGAWGPAKQIPGLAALAASSGDRQITADVLSCPAVGDCLAAGTYNANSEPAKYFPGEHARGYLAEEVRGTWHKAVPVPGLAKLNTGGVVDIAAVSCASPGNCAITGSYTPGKPDPLNAASQAFVVSEVGGVWHAATPVPGIVKLNAGGQAFGLEISCAAPGYCALGGDYSDSATNGRPFIDSEVNGTWGAAIPAPGKPSGYYGTFRAVSCPKPGECVAVWGDANGSYAFTQRGAGWSPAVAISGLGEVTVLSCPAAGACVAAGATSRSERGWAAVAAESGGRWGKAVMVPGAKAYAYKGKLANSEITDMSCPAPGYCVVGGHFVAELSESAYRRGLVASETAGRWGTAQVLPGLAKLDAESTSEVPYVACSAAATCVAAGTFSPAEYIRDGFVATELPLRRAGAPASPAS